MNDYFIRQFAGQFGTDPVPVSLRFGTITAVTAGGSTDGLALVTVSINGSAVKVPFNLAYTPTVGHYVAVLIVNSQPFLLGRAGGFPPT